MGPVFFIRVHHMTPGELGVWLSWIVALGGGIGTFAGGWLADRWIRQEPRARLYVSLIGVLLSIPFNVATLLLPDHRLALLCAFPANMFGTFWLGPSVAVIQELVPPTMRAMASAIFCRTAGDACSSSYTSKFDFTYCGCRGVQ